MTKPYVTPRYQKIEESTDQFIKYFDTLVEKNNYDDKKAAFVFRVLIHPRSHTALLVRHLDINIKSSYAAIKNSLIGSRTPNRIISLLKLTSLQQRPSESLNDLVLRTSRLVTEAYGDGFEDLQRNILIRNFFFIALPVSIRSKIIQAGDLPDSVNQLRDLAEFIHFSNKLSNMSTKNKAEKTPRCNLQLWFI